MKRRGWHSIPAAILPFLVLLVLSVIFFATDVPFFRFLMETVFDGNAVWLVAVLLIYCFATVVFGITCFILAICKRWDAVTLAKHAMILKLIQIPAYILIFIVGAAMMLTIVTFAFSIGLFLLDCVTLFLSGLPILAAAINAARDGTMPLKRSVWVIVLQCIFCADVVAAIVFYRKLKKATAAV